MLRAKATDDGCRLPTMILAECVLVYLDPDEGTKIIKHFGESLPNAVFTVYEQVHYVLFLSADKVTVS